MFPTAHKAVQLLLMSGSAYSYYYEPSYGGQVPNNETRRLLQYANANPNATRSLSMKPFAQLQSYPDLQSTKWSWRVNVSDFAAPNADNPIALVDPHAVSVVQDFSWPGNGSMSSSLVRLSRFCTTNLMILDLPANVSNGYADANAGSSNPTDCTSALGAPCVSAILRSSLTGYGCVASMGVGSRECASTLGYALDALKFLNALGYNHAAGQPINSTDGVTGGLRPGEAFWNVLTGPFNASNATTYLAATNMLQIVRLDLQANVSGVSVTVPPQLHCMRVNATQLSSDLKFDANGDGFVMTGEAAAGEAAAGVSKNAAAAAAPGAWLGGLTALAMLAGALL